MGVLTKIPSNIIYTRRSRIVVNPAFDTVLEVQKLYREEELTDYEKMEQALKMFVVNKWNLRILTMAEKRELLNEIFKRHIQTKKRFGKPEKNRVLDFEEDGDYIYASFMQDYGIDLIDEQGKMPWNKFLYLFNGLSDDTKIKQVMRIRDMEVPKYNGKNSKEIQRVQELKSYYALPVRGGGGKTGLDLLFTTLEGLAK